MADHRFHVYAALVALSLSVLGSCAGRDEPLHRGRSSSSTSLDVATRPAARWPAASAFPVTRRRIPQFEDVTSARGLALEGVPPSPSDCFLSVQYLAGKFPGQRFRGDGQSLCQVERFTGGVAVGDANGDGWPDLYVPRLREPGRLLLNDGGRRFVDATNAAGVGGLVDPSSGAVWADVDSDGDFDLVVNTIAARRPQLFLNDGRGVFQEVGAERGFAGGAESVQLGFSVAVGDYDRDGYDDLFVTSYLPPDRLAPFPVARPRLLRNRGASAPGYFVDDTAALGIGDSAWAGEGLYAFGASFADFDGDGWPDLYVTADFGTSRLFWNRGDGTFDEGTSRAGVGTEENGMGSATADFDGDGKLDRFVTSVFDARGDSIAKGGNWGATGNRLFRNAGGRRFVDVTDAAGVRDGQWGWGAAVGDFLNDGYTDVVQASGLDFDSEELVRPYLSGATRLWHVGPSGRFEDRATDAGLTVRNTRAVATLDVDQDGRLDVLLAGPGAVLTLYRNVTPEVGHWLGVRVRGPAGAGALVEFRVAGDNRRRISLLGTSSDYLGNSEPIARVGTGEGLRVESVTVSAPGWKEEVVLQNLPVDQVVEVQRP